MAPKKKQAKIPKGFLAPLTLAELMQMQNPQGSSGSGMAVPIPVQLPQQRLVAPVLDPTPIPPNQVQGDRADRPTYLPTLRGSMTLALTGVESAAAREAALAALDSDMYAASSKKPRASSAKTWEVFHVAWFGTGTPIFPITVPKLLAVGALFKQGKYRSFQNSLSTMKDEHITLGHLWSEQLSRCSTKVERSVSRGIGPSRQCVGLDLVAVSQLGLPKDQLSQGGPIGPGNLVVAGSFFMLREIEASLALWQSVTFDVGARLVSWNLPASKSDPKALGKTRSWGCLCTNAVAGGMGPCPYHALWSQRAVVAAMLSRDVEDLKFVPVFPDLYGDVVTKAAVVRTVQAVAALTGMAPARVSGVTGHVCRITGSQHLAMLGFDIVLIMLMARWASDIVHHYISEAPLGSITEKYRQLAAGRSLESVLESLVTEVAGLRGRVDAMVAPMADTFSSERLLRQASESADGSTNTGFIMNLESNKIHAPVLFSPGGMPTKAKCGWTVEPLSYEMVTVLPRLDPQLICGMCLPRYKQECVVRRATLDRDMLGWESCELHGGVEASSSDNGSSSSDSSDS